MDDTAQNDAASQKQADQKAGQGQNINTGAGVSGEREAGLLDNKTEDEMMAEIREIEKERDNEALAAVEKEIGEVRVRTPEIVIPGDVADAGVYAPEEAASKVIENGSTLEIPFSESTYQKAQAVRIGGSSMRKSIVGVPSLVAAAIWVGRLIKIAHKHTMRVVFRKKENEREEGFDAS